MSSVVRFACLDGRATQPLASEERLRAAQPEVPREIEESALEPPVVADPRARAAHQGLFVTWSGAEDAVGFRIALWHGRTHVRTEYVPATVSAVYVGALEVGERYRVEVAALNAGRVGEAVATEEVQPVSSPLAPGVAEELAKAYLRADAELMTGNAETADAAVNAAKSYGPHSAGVGAALAVEAAERIGLRDRLAQRGLRYVNFAPTVLGSALIPNENGDEAVLHAIVDETWSLHVGDSGSDEITDSRSVRRYSVTCDLRGGGAVRAVERSSDFGPAQQVPADAEEVAETDASQPEPTSVDEGGGSVTEGGEPEPLAVNNGSIVRYARRYWAHKNDDYTSYDNDCTNFASQCCHAGGLQEITGWYRSDEAWWYNGNWVTYCSYPWRVAHSMFNHMWKKKRARFRQSTAHARAGDVLFWDFDGNGHIDHVSVINANRSGRLFYTQHSDPHWNRPLAAGLHGHPKAKIYIAHLTG